MRRTHAWLTWLGIAALGSPASTLRPVEAGDSAKPDGSAPRCLVSGRILDEYAEGVRDAKVTWISDSPAGDQSRGEPVRTDASGGFRLSVEGPAEEELRGAVHVTRGDDAAAIAPVRVRVGAAEHEESPIALTSARPLQVDVRRENAPVPNAEVWLWSWAGDMNRGRPAFLGTAVADRRGQAAFTAIPHAYLKVLVRAPDGAVGEATRQVVLGSAPSRLRVDVLRSRAVRVLVMSDAMPTVPIAGAIVRRRLPFSVEDLGHSFAPEALGRIALTRSDGSVLVDGIPADGTVELEARIAGHPVGSTHCGPGETTATIVIPKPTLIPVEAGERPPPPDGTKLVVRYRRMETVVEGWMDRGAIAVPLREYQVEPGLAVAPDGTLAPLKRLEPTSFFRPRSLVVRIVEKGGDEIAGTKVSLASSPYLEGPWDEPVPTDAEGGARFTGLAPTKHFIYAFPTAQRPHGHRVDEVDLRAGDVTRTVVVGAEVTILARMNVDGEPAIPESLWWTIPNGIVTDSTTDRVAGLVRIHARPDAIASATGSIEFGGRGVRPDTFGFAWPAGGGTTSLDVSLFRAPEVIVEVRADPDSDTEVFLEHWSPWNRRSPWVALHHVYPHLRGRTSVELERGRYRLHDMRTGILSDPFEVPDRGGRVLATLDLTGLVTIRGTVDGPDAADAAMVTIGVEGVGIDSQVEFAPPYYGANGLPYDGKSFAVRVPAGRPVTLRPCHHTLQPSREGGEVTLIGPRDDIILKVGSGATLVVKLADVDGLPLPAAALEEVLLAAVPADHPLREAVLRSARPIEGRAGTVSASDMPFGTLDLWVLTDLLGSGGYAARRVKRTTVTEDRVDLGELRLTRGARVVIRRVDKDRSALSLDDVRSCAVGMFGPRQWIAIDRPEADEGAIGQFKNLGAGRWYFRVVAARRTHAGDIREEREAEVDVDGEHDVTVDVNFDDLPATKPN